MASLRCTNQCPLARAELSRLSAPALSPRSWIKRAMKYKLSGPGAPELATVCNACVASAVRVHLIVHPSQGRGRFDRLRGVLPILAMHALVDRGELQRAVALFFVVLLGQDLGELVRSWKVFRRRRGDIFERALGRFHISQHPGRDPFEKLRIERFRI